MGPNNLDSSSRILSDLFLVDSVRFSYSVEFWVELRVMNTTGKSNSRAYLTEYTADMLIGCIPNLLLNRETSISEIYSCFFYRIGNNFSRLLKQVTIDSIDGSKEASGTCLPPSKFFHFHAAFCNKFAKYCNGLAHPLWELAFPSGKSWIHHWIHLVFRRSDG